MTTTTPYPVATLTPPRPVHFPPRPRPSAVRPVRLAPAADSAGPVAGVTIRRRFTGSFVASCMGVAGVGRTEVAALQDMGRKLRAGSFAGR
jgi:hypothetical protein